MVDSYRPGRRSGHDRSTPPRGDHYRSHRRDRASHGRTPSPSRDSHRNSRRSGAYDYEEDRHHSGSHSQQADRHYSGPEIGFTFRGAATRDRREPEPVPKFSFRTDGPRAPSFEPHADLDGQGSRRLRDAPRRAPSGRHDRDRYGRAAASHERSSARRYGPRPAYQRDLLQNQHRAGTPPQMQGMSATYTRFIMPILSEDSDASDDAPRLKRAKVDAAPAPTVPKWSNPDPYTALPPPSASTEPKQDLVQVIRKAKLDAFKAKAVARKSGIEKNDDIILLDSRHDDDTNRDKNLKRKHRSERPRHAVLSEWQPRAGHNKTPWHKPSLGRISTTGQSFHVEIENFFDYVRPRPTDQAVRLDLMYRTSRVLEEFSAPGFNSVEVHAFGSFASSLYLPLADMDLVAMSSSFINRNIALLCQSSSKIRKLQAHIERSGIAQNGSLISITKARVPLIKWVDRRTGIKVDLSFENASGLYAIPTINKWKTQYPAMPAIVILIKQLLAMHGHNEVSIGGIGGFTIICLVVSMLQHKPEVEKDAMAKKQDYGNLLISFLELYGGRFDYKGLGIIMDPPMYVPKRELRHANPNPERLSIIDPNNEQNDLAGGSKNVDDIFDLFRVVRGKLQERLSELSQREGHNQSILECCLGANYTAYDEQKVNLNQAYLKVQSSGVLRPALPLPRFVVNPSASSATADNSERRDKRSNAALEHHRHSRKH